MNAATDNGKVGPVEVHGVKGLQSKPFRKTFATPAAFDRWLDANAGDVEIHGFRAIEEGK